MKLERPLIFLDIESATANENSPDPQRDRIIEIAAVKYTPQFGLDDPSPVCLYDVCNPGIPIHPKCTEVHGWTDEKVKDKPPFKTVAQRWLDFIATADLAGFGVWKYDLPLIVAECERNGFSFCWRSRRVFDGSMIMTKKEERTLTAAARFYLKRDHAGAHGAIADTQMSIDVFKAQMQFYPDVGVMSQEALHKFCQFDDAERLTLDGAIVKGPDGDPIYTHKKVRGVKVKDDLGYARWMLYKADFPRDTREWLEAYIQSLQSPAKEEFRHERDPELF